jgi:hypothetical protein
MLFIFILLILCPHARSDEITDEKALAFAKGHQSLIDSIYTDFYQKRHGRPGYRKSYPDPDVWKDIFQAASDSSLNNRSFDQIDKQLDLYFSYYNDAQKAQSHILELNKKAQEKHLEWVEKFKESIKQNAPQCQRVTNIETYKLERERAGRLSKNIPLDDEVFETEETLLKELR